MTDSELHFFNDTGLVGRETNVFTRRKMIEGFSTVENLDVVVHYVASDKDEGLFAARDCQGSKVKNKPVWLKPLNSRNSRIRSIYRSLVLNRLLDIVYFWRFIKYARNSTSYVWGLQSSIAALVSNCLVSNTFILELDDYMFGEDRIKDSIYLKAASSAVKVSTVSEQTKKDLVNRGINPEKVEVLPNAVEFERFNLNTQNGIRQDLGISNQDFVVTYTGHLYEWKGVKTLIEAVKHIQFENLEILIFGGNRPEIEEYRKRVEEAGLEEIVRVGGYIPRKKVPKYQNASDVLVVPNTSESEKSVKYTSPVKLREYMASGTPVVASSLPSIQETADREEIFYFEPDNPKDLADKITMVRNNPEKAAERAEKAKKKAREYSWVDRATKLLQDLV